MSKLGNLILTGTLLVTPSMQSVCNHIATNCQAFAMARDSGVPFSIISKKVTDSNMLKVARVIYNSDIQPDDAYNTCYSLCVLELSKELY